MLCFQEDGEEIQDRANMLISNFGAVQCPDGGVGSDGKLKCKWLASSEGSCLFKHQDSDMLLKGKGVTKDLEKGRPGTPPRAVTGDGGSVLDPPLPPPPPAPEPLPTLAELQQVCRMHDVVNPHALLPIFKFVKILKSDASCRGRRRW
jgi:hypothetical protein